MIGPLRSAFDLGLRSSRMPLDAALHLTGRSNTIHQLRLDRAEAGVRIAVGSLLGDEELLAQGERGMDAAHDRERAAGLRD
jgi:hypothetical protein